MNRKQVLKKHQLKSFKANLSAIEFALKKRIDFLSRMDEVYHFTTSVKQSSVVKYSRWLRSIERLKDFDL